MGLRSGRRARSANEGAKDRYERATVLRGAALRRRGVLFPLPTPAEGNALPRRAHGQGRRAPSAGAPGGLRAPQPLPGGGPPDREPPRVRAGRQGAARGVLQVRGVQDISSPPSTGLGPSTVKSVPRGWAIGATGGQHKGQALSGPRLARGGIGSSADVVLGEREIQEPVPVGVYLPGHGLVVGAVLAGNLGRLWVAGPLGDRQS